jgi:predicted acylesterase/phospholipase RssA
MGASPAGSIQPSVLNVAEKKWNESVTKVNEYSATTFIKSAVLNGNFKQTSVENFTNYAEALIADFPTRGLSLSAAARIEFNDQVRLSLNELVDRFGEIVNEQTSNADVKAAIKTANHDVRLLVSTLQGEFARDVINETPNNLGVPNIIRKPDGSYISIAKAPAVEELNFSGGGAKGAVYPSVIGILEQAGHMEGVVRMSGTSAGGITATLLAAGMNAEGYQTFADEVPMDTLKANVANFAQRYTGITIADHGLVGIENSGQKAVHLIDHKLYTMVQASLEGVDLDLDALNSNREDDLFTQAEADRLTQLRDVDMDTNPRDETMLTFKDLQLLRKLDPTAYKELQLTGYNTQNNEGVLFNADTTPNMPIAYAARITMALPGLFKAVKFPAEGNAADDMRANMDDGVAAMMEEGVFVDGGFYTNVPYIERDGVSQAKTRTLAFQIGRYATDALHGPSANAGEPGPSGLGTSDKMSAQMAGRYGGNNNLSAVYRQDMETLYNLGHGVIVMAHGDLSTTDLNPSPETLALAKQDAETGVLAYLAMTANEAFHTDYINLNQAVNETYDTLNDADKDRILNQNRANLTPENQALYDLVFTKLTANNSASNLD